MLSFVIKAEMTGLLNYVYFIATVKRGLLFSKYVVVVKL